MVSFTHTRGGCNCAMCSDYAFVDSDSGRSISHSFLNGAITGMLGFDLKLGRKCEFIGPYHILLYNLYESACMFTTIANLPYYNVLQHSLSVLKKEKKLISMNESMIILIFILKTYSFLYEEHSIHYYNTSLRID